MDRFLRIVQKPATIDVEINEEMLKYFNSQVKIWNNFSISQQKCLLLPLEERATMLKKYYVELQSRQSSGNIFFVFVFFFVV